MKTNFKLNAIDLLRQVVEERNWHKGLLTTQLANRHKKSIIAGTIKYSTATLLLESLGYELMKPEEWRKKSEVEVLKESANNSPSQSIQKSVKLTKAVYTKKKKPIDKNLRLGKGHWK